MGNAVPSSRNKHRLSNEDSSVRFLKTKSARIKPKRPVRLNHMFVADFGNISSLHFVLRRILTKWDENRLRKIWGNLRWGLYDLKSATVDFNFIFFPSECERRRKKTRSYSCFLWFFDFWKNDPYQ